MGNILRPRARSIWTGFVAIYVHVDYGQSTYTYSEFGPAISARERDAESDESREPHRCSSGLHDTAYLSVEPDARAIAWQGPDALGRLCCCGRAKASTHTRAVSYLCLY